MGASDREKEEDGVLVARTVLPMLLVLDMRCISHCIPAASPDDPIPMVAELGKAYPIEALLAVYCRMGLQRSGAPPLETLGREHAYV
jgi:hypothetical protein